MRFFLENGEEMPAAWAADLQVPDDVLR